jgi:hypothetical protein
LINEFKDITDKYLYLTLHFFAQIAILFMLSEIKAMLILRANTFSLFTAPESDPKK